MQSDKPSLNKQPITQHSDTIFDALEESCCDLKLKPSQKEVPLKFGSGKLSLFDLLFQSSRQQVKADMSFVLCVNTTSRFCDENCIYLINWSYPYNTVVVTTPNYLTQQFRIKIIVYKDAMKSTKTFEYFTPKKATCHWKTLLWTR